MNQIPPDLAEQERKLTFLLLELRSTDVLPRANLYIERMTGGRQLADYIRDPSTPLRDRQLVAMALTDILLTKDYSRLPPASEVTIAKSRLEPRLPDDLDGDDENDDEDDEEQLVQLVREELRRQLSPEIRRQLAEMFSTVAKVFKEKA